MELDMVWKKMILVIACAMLSTCFAQDGVLFPEKPSSVQLEKVYVSLDQLFINEIGMFLVFQEEPVPVDALFRDQRGLYILENQLEQGYTFYECPNGHPSRHGDGRCNQRSCPYFRG